MFACERVKKMTLIQLFMTDVFIFIDESTCEETDIQAKIEENMEILKKYIKEHDIYSLFPFKG